MLVLNEIKSQYEVTTVKGIYSVCIIAALTLFFSVKAEAYHPLITDDTGTQGKGKSQVEVQAEFTKDRSDSDGVVNKSKGSLFTAVYSYGLTENLDIIFGMPYQFNRSYEDGALTEKHSGISDISLEMKWRFYEKDGFSLALKPFVTLPTGDDDKGLGSGRSTYGSYLIVTQEFKSLDFHVNLGYIRNENKLDEKKNLWHASAAAGVEVIKDLKLVANIGIERNPDTEVLTNPAFVLGGIVYAVSETLDISAGLKKSLNSPETDTSVLVGLTWRF